MEQPSINCKIKKFSLIKLKEEVFRELNKSIALDKSKKKKKYMTRTIKTISIHGFMEGIVIIK